MHTRSCQRVLGFVVVFSIVFTLLSTVCEAWTPIVIKNVTVLGPQLSPDVTNVSRDGGYSVLVNGYIVWLYDDTECLGSDGDQLSFVSNTAAIASQTGTNLSTVQNFGVVEVGKDKSGKKQYAILADSTVGTGGWIPFLQDELEYNKAKDGKERVAIWPGTSPTPISLTQAFIFAPLVYVDSKPQDPSTEYQARGMALITVTAPKSGPVATRQGDLVISGTQVPFGGFTALLGSPSSESNNIDPNDRDVYLLAMTQGGLQMARVCLNNIADFSKYTFFDPQSLNFTSTAPSLNTTDEKEIYLAGTFSSGGVFYSPYFSTFLMIYFDKMADSTFFIRYLDLSNPLGNDQIWIIGGKHGAGIQPEDVESLVKYAWSAEQKLYTSRPGKGGFNYAGMPHPEYFNRQYFAQSLYPDSTPSSKRVNDWYGGGFVGEADAQGDGRYLLLSWTSQAQGGQDNGIYQIQLAVLEFDDIPSVPIASASPSSSVWQPSPQKTPANMIPSGGKTVESFLNYDQDEKYYFGRILFTAIFIGSVAGRALF